MDKKEAHEIWLTLNEVCLEHKDCIGCPFYIIFDNIQSCAVNHKRSNDVGHILFNAAYEVQSPCTPPEHVGPIVVKTKGPSNFDLQKPFFTSGALEPVEEKLGNVIKHDNVNSPKHYCKGGLECIDVIRAAVSNLPPFEAVCVANIIKYAWRYKDKNGLEDVKKAAKYLQLLQEEVAKNHAK